MSGQGFHHFGSLDEDEAVHTALGKAWHAVQILNQAYQQNYLVKETWKDAASVFDAFCQGEATLDQLKARMRALGRDIDALHEPPTSP